MASLGFPFRPPGRFAGRAPRWAQAQPASGGITTSTWPERPVLLAVDQELGEGAALRVAPELSDAFGSLKVGEHQDVEQLAAGSRPERVETLL